MNYEKSIRRFFLLCAHSVPHTNKCHMKRTVAEHTATHVHFNEIFTQELRLIDFQIDTRTLHLFCASLPFIFHIYSMFGSVQQFAVIFSCHFVIRKSWQSYSFNWHQLYWPYWINMEYRNPKLLFGTASMIVGALANHRIEMKPCAFVIILLTATQLIHNGMEFLMRSSLLW